MAAGFGYTLTAHKEWAAQILAEGDAKKPDG